MFKLRVSRDYLDDATALRDLFVNRSAVSALECALRSYSDRLSGVQSRRSSSRIHARVGYRELRSVFPEVKCKVDSYLGSAFMSEPPVLFGPSSGYVDGVVYVEPCSMAGIVSSLAHEYCHHVQVDYLGVERLLPVLAEGHAVGVEMHVAGCFSENFGDDAFLLSPLSRQVSRLKASYMWVCANHRKIPEKSLLGVSSCCDESESGYLRRYGRPSVHAIGAAFFTLMRPSDKDRAYKEFLTGSLYF